VIQNRKTLFLRIFACSIQIDCCGAQEYELLLANYGGLQSRERTFPKLKYTISRRSNRSCFSIARWGGEPVMAADEGEFLFLFEKDLTIQLELMRRDLYFLHAAALGSSGRAFLLVAPSGNGKSTITWALLHHGFRYLSDELAPLNLTKLEVQPYPHAICLKEKPPAPYDLPDQAVRTVSTVHVPIPQLPGGAIYNPMTVTAVFFLEYRSGRNPPIVRRVSRAESAARLFANALNPLAHAEDGLAGAVAIAQRVPSFQLRSGELRPTCELIAAALQSAAAQQDSRAEIA
jgi:hypothetical protein